MKGKTMKCPESRAWPRRLNSDGPELVRQRAELRLRGRAEARAHLCLARRIGEELKWFGIGLPPLLA